MLMDGTVTEVGMAAAAARGTARGHWRNRHLVPALSRLGSAVWRCQRTEKVEGADRGLAFPPPYPPTAERVNGASNPELARPHRSGRYILVRLVRVSGTCVVSDGWWWWCCMRSSSFVGRSGLTDDEYNPLSKRPTWDVTKPTHLRL